jgi:iron complex outermembrane recepter protein
MGRAALNKMNKTCIAACLMGLAASPAFAQTAESANQPAAAANQLEDIIVTAEKRASTVQDTPISMTAVSGEELQKAGITDLSGVVREVPGISMRTAGPGQTEIEMRGLSSSGGAAPTVGFYLNDYPLTPPAAALVGKVVIDPDLFDLNRVEVLRGPQGTLYGSGSMGGTVKLVTNTPTLNKFESTVNALGSQTSGGGFNYGVNAMLNIPLSTDTAALRIVVTDKHNDGWIDRIVENPFPLPVNPGPCGPGWPGCTRGDVTSVSATQVVPRSNTEHLTGARAELAWFPNDKLQVDSMVMYQRISDDGYNEYDDPPGTSAGLKHYQPFNLSEPFSDNFYVLGTTVTYDMGYAKLTSATAYYSRKESQDQDDSEALYSFFPLFGYTPPIEPILFNETDQTQQLSEELRLTSSGAGPLQWIVGAFFARFESTFGEYSASVPVAYGSSGGAAANPLGIIYQAHNPYAMRQYAIFGESTYAVAEQVKVTAGVRLYRFQSTADEEISGIAATGNGAQQTATFNAANNGVNPKLTVAYEPSNALNVYGTIARGFRPGGINQQIPASLCNLTAETYGPDSTWNFEIGEKAKLAEGRVTLNTDFYYIRWSQVQQVVNQPCGYPLTMNAGDAASYGPEVELAARLSPEVTVNLSGTYNHAQLTTVPDSVNTADSALHSGTPILNIPKYTLMASLNYATRLWDDKKLAARISDSFVGSATDIAFTYETLGSYNLADARVGITADKWSAYLFADNLGNTHAMLGVNTSSFAFQSPSLVRVATNTPRTVGVDLTYHF